MSIRSSRVGKRELKLVGLPQSSVKTPGFHLTRAFTVPRYVWRSPFDFRPLAIFTYTGTASAKSGLTTET